MFELIFLGTSASRPTARRGLPALVVTHEATRVLIDCGEGTQRQLVRSGLGFRHLEHVLLTHAHLDHVLGLGGLVTAFAEDPALKRLSIYGGHHALAIARELAETIVMPETDAGVSLNFHTLEPNLVVELGGLTITAVPVPHRGEESYAYLFAEAPKRHLDPARADALGVPEGPLRHELAQGATVTTPDGRNVRSNDVMGADQPGTRLLVVGDVGETTALDETAQDVDGLVIEATFLEAEREIARKSGHITAAQAARLARRTAVGRLYLTHISGRYEGDEILTEARAIFPACEVAEDFSRFDVKARDGA